MEAMGGGIYPSIYKELTRPYLEYYHYDEHVNAGHARNVGLEHAKGKWLVFADADDLFSDEFIYILDKHLSDDEDILFFKSLSCYSTDLSKKSDRADVYNILICDFLNAEVSTEETLRLCFDVPWAKFIKKQLVEEHQIKFAEVDYSNDVYFSVMTGMKAKSIACYEEYVYVVTYRPGSLTSKRFKSAKELRTRNCIFYQKQSLLTDYGYELKVHPATSYLPLTVATNPIVFWEFWHKIPFTGITKKQAFNNIVRERRWLVKVVFVTMFILTCPLSVFSRIKKNDISVCAGE